MDIRYCRVFEVGTLVSVVNMRLLNDYCITMNKQSRRIFKSNDFSCRILLNLCDVFASWIGIFRDEYAFSKIYS